MQLQPEFRRAAFNIWLRTGRWLQPLDSDCAERKFNPNHDPANGRFTGGGGSSGGGGASGSWGGEDGSPGRPHANRSAAAAQWPATSARKPAIGGRGQGTRPSTGALPPGSAAKPHIRTTARNGYTYAIDEQGRTREISGAIKLNPGQIRSRRAQREAGGPDRLPTDVGGHYIARRFDGPTEAFNHFAQDASFNRRDYAAVEKQWETAKKEGKSVLVRIVPRYEATSTRPLLLDISFSINGNRQSVKLPNARRDI